MRHPTHSTQSGPIVVIKDLNNREKLVGFAAISAVGALVDGPVYVDDVRLVMYSYFDRVPAVDTSSSFCLSFRNGGRLGWGNVNMRAAMLTHRRELQYPKHHYHRTQHQGGGYGRIEFGEIHGPA